MRIALVGAELEENLAVRYIRAALEAEGHVVEQITFNDIEQLEDAAHRLAASGAALAGFSMVFTYRAREFATLARRARVLGFNGHLVAGGHFAAFNAEALLGDVPAFDSVALGEGEAIACDLARNLGDLGVVRGLVWRAEDGRIMRNEAAEKPVELDHLPRPVRKLPFNEYLGLPIVNMLSSRGCTHACAFCSIAAWHRFCGGVRFRQRDPECVAQEMADLYERGVHIFNFHDDNFFLGSAEETRRRVERMASIWKRRGMGRIAFAVKSRPDSVDAELFGWLKSLGLFRVFLGIEAGTAEDLKRLGRGQTLEQNERALKVVNGLDLHACFNLLMLNPDSSLEDVRANLAFLRAHPEHPMNFCRTEVYSGTPLEERLRRAGRLRGDYWGYGYRIADPRAQAVFEIVYRCMPRRHYGEPNVQHQTMNVAYEQQLLGHFFGSHPRQHARARDYIRRVNLDTCERLERVVIWAEGHAPDAVERKSFEEQLARETAASNEAFLAEGRRLLADIRRSAKPAQSQVGRWGRRVAAAGLAAALTFSAPVATSAEEMAPMPPREEGRAEDVRDQFKSAVLPFIAERLERPCRLRIEFEVKPNGQMERCGAWNADTEALVPALIPAVTFEKAEARGHEFTLVFDEVDVASARIVRVQRTIPALLDRVRDAVRLRNQILRPLALAVIPERNVCLEVWVNTAGYIENVLLFDESVSLRERELTDAERVEAGEAIKGFSSEDFQTREASDKKLKDMGRAVLPLIRNAQTTEQDAETRLRCEHLIRVLEGRVSEADLTALALAEFGQVADANARGKRFRIPFSRVDLIRARQQQEQEITHPFEMAPAPRD